MRTLIAGLAGAAALSLAAGSAFADTLEEFTSKGGVLNIEGLPPIDISFSKDGKFTGLMGLLNGTWKIDADKLCLKGDDGNETCTVYPQGKKSGDTFDVTMPQGKASVKIN